MFTGSCLCGACRYQLSETLTDLCYCHCSTCRKRSGSGYAAYGTVSKSRFRWLSGARMLICYSPTSKSRRYSCNTCGAYLLTEHDSEPENVFVALGSLDSAIAEKPGYRQFMASNAHWCEIHDNLRQYPQWPT